MSAAGKRHMGRVASLGCIVDPIDSHFLDRTHWVDGSGYVRVYINRDCQPRLHRLICQAGDGLVVDHINGNKLDNRRANLRACTQADNTKNARLRADNASGVKGVWFDRQRGKWAAQIQTNGVRSSLGRFETFREAFEARVAAERKQWGEFSNV